MQMLVYTVIECYDIICKWLHIIILHVTQLNFFSTKAKVILERYK